MEQHNGKKPWEYDHGAGYKCISLYYGCHNGIYGRELQIYKTVKVKRCENKHNKRYLFRRYLNGIFMS